jgi:hypothetical protein
MSRAAKSANKRAEFFGYAFRIAAIKRDDRFVGGDRKFPARPTETTVCFIAAMLFMQMWRDGAHPAQRPEQARRRSSDRSHERGDGGGNGAEARCVRDAQGPFQQRREHNPAAQSGRSAQENLTVA